MTQPTTDPNTQQIGEGLKESAPDVAAANASHTILAMFDELRGSVPEATFDNWPSDLSGNLKHYLYGFCHDADCQRPLQPTR